MYGPSPINSTSVPDPERESKAPWVIRKLVGSMTGRVILSTYETVRATGTSVICLSPWGDSSPLLLPCIRVRDLAFQTIVVATGGAAALAEPIAGPVSDILVSTIGDSIIVDMGMHVGFKVGYELANDLIIEEPLEKLIPSNDRRLITTSIKTMTITLKFKHLVTDANLGFFRGSVHKNNTLFSDVKDYFSIEKGWFSPYLFASNRRPVIFRSMTPDVVFCHGPFLKGDYEVGQKLLEESATVIQLCYTPTYSYPVVYEPIYNNIAQTPSSSPPERRLLITVVGIKPHRTSSVWSTSHRPEESVIRYLMLNGVPSIVIPANTKCPRIAWDTLTLESLYKIEKEKGGAGVQGVVEVLLEYLSLYVDWNRMIAPTGFVTDWNTGVLEGKRSTLRNAVGVLVAGAVKSKESKAVTADVDLKRAGFVMFRIP